MNGPSSTTSPGRGTLGPLALLGELDVGVVAEAHRGGVARFPDGTQVSWWIGAEDRWHRPAVEASARDRRIDGTPVLESLVRIPSGDAVGRIGVGRVDGVDRPSLVVDVENASPIPVAFAYVIESASPLRPAPDGVTVDGIGRLVLTRPALGYACAADVDALVDVLSAGGMVDAPPVWDRAGAVAVLVPLPHTAHAVATFTPDAPTDESAAALADRERIPSPDRLVAGWATHLGPGPRFDGHDERDVLDWNEALCDVLLAAATGSDDAITAALVVEALARTGRVDDPGPVLDLLDVRRSNGSFRGADPVAATVLALRALGAWWSGGASASFADELLGPVADAARWLGARRRRASLIAAGPDAPQALVAAAGLLADRGQAEVAGAVAALAAELTPDGPGPGPDPDGNVDVADRFAVAARAVITGLADVVAETPDGIAVAPGWTPADRGAPLEAHDVPTRWGRLSYGVRWHGPRPALLWELVAWPGREVAAPRLTAPALDPSWSSGELAGEALLASPALDEPLLPGGGSFS